MVHAGRAQVRHILDTLRAEEYFAAASTPRFRALERRLTWRASRAAMLVIAVAAPFHILALSLLHPAAAEYILVLTGTLGLLALGAWLSLGRALRHRPEPVVFIVSLAVAVATMVLAVSGPRLVELSIGYLLFLPTLVALVVPWRSWTEARWLAVYGIMGVIFFVTFPPDGPLAVDDRQDLIFALLVALSAAFTGHVLLYRGRIRSFKQVQALGRLQRQQRRQSAELLDVYRSLEITARTDQLTGTHNRLKLDEDLKSARGRLTRTRVPFGLLVLDLDYFKEVNDALGHLAGDDVLRRVAQALREAIRDDDAVYRFGGEEFLILLGAVAGGVLEVAERVRKAVEDLAIPHPANPPFGHVTISVGAAVIQPSDAGATNDEWFGRVDAALYRAKADGRNRVEVAPPAPRTSPSRAARPTPASPARRLLAEPGL